MSANFSDLQSVDTANGADQMMLRLNNGATGPDGFARIEISDLNSVFTSSLTAADAKVKQMSAQWDESYSLVSANSSVFALTNSNSAFWNTAYFALTTNDYNYGNKVFDNIVINGPADISRLGPVFQIKRDPNTTVDMMQVIPATTNSMVRITTAGQVGINVGNDFVIASDIFLYINGNQRIDGSGGNALTINGDMFVNGSLSALSATYINSIVTNTSALSISSNGGGPALYVNQYDTNSVEDITQFQSNAANIIFKGNGNVTGIRDLSAFGRIIAGSSNIASNAASYILGTNNNDNLNNVIILGSNISAHTANYTYVQNLSTAGTVATIGGTSFDWNLTTVLVKSQSAVFLSLSSTVLSQSANNASVYSTVSANSATWSALSTAFRVVSAVDTSALSAVGLNANINAALVAKGTGATLAQIPDGAVAGGIDRGVYATDLQKIRNDANQVARGRYSVVAGGSANYALGDYSVIVGGSSNTATADDATIGGGRLNVISGGPFATIGGGESNSATNSFATIGGGRNLSASGQYSTIAGGRSLTATGNYSTIAGGYSSRASGEFSFVAGGQNNDTNNLSNTFILGSNIKAAAANYTYVNNLSSQGTVKSSTATISSLSAIIGTIDRPAFKAKYTATNYLAAGDDLLINFSEASRHYINLFSAGEINLYIQGLTEVMGSEIVIYILNQNSGTRKINLFYGSPAVSYAALPIAISPTSVGQTYVNNITLQAAGATTTGMAAIIATNFGSYGVLAYAV